MRGEGEPRREEDAPKGGQPGQNASEVVAGGGEDGVGGVAVPSFKEVAAHSVLVLGLREIALNACVSLSALEIWFCDVLRQAQDEGSHRPEKQDRAPLGQRGTRPSAPHDQRTASTSIFGAICPNDGKGAGLVLPLCNTQAMNLHLQEVAKAVAPGKHAVLLMDQADWHISAKLAVPARITLVALPPQCPELNPTEIA